MPENREGGPLARAEISKDGMVSLLAAEKLVTKFDPLDYSGTGSLEIAREIAEQCAEVINSAHSAAVRPLVALLDFAVSTLQDAGFPKSGNVPTEEKVALMKKALSAYRQGGEEEGNGR